MEIITFWGEQTNPFYDQCTANNGGGYWQVEGGALFDINGRLISVNVQDLSCGDFGTRMYAQIHDEEHSWLLSWGSMDDASLDGLYPDPYIVASASNCIGADATEMLSIALDAANTAALKGCVEN